MLHLVKLVSGVKDVAEWQARVAGRARKRKGRQVYVTHTRNQPKRRDELVGGSYFFVFRGGVIRCRQEILGFGNLVSDDEERRWLEILLSPEVVPTEARTYKKFFQGWRYLAPEEAPPDLREGDDAGEMPAEMLAELRDLGLL